jgi:hypothetical protein
MTRALLAFGFLVYALVSGCAFLILCVTLAQ